MLRERVEDARLQLRREMAVHQPIAHLDNRPARRRHGLDIVNRHSRARQQFLDADTAGDGLLNHGDNDIGGRLRGSELEKSRDGLRASDGCTAWCRIDHHAAANRRERRIAAYYETIAARQHRGRLEAYAREGGRPWWKRHERHEILPG